MKFVSSLFTARRGVVMIMVLAVSLLSACFGPRGFRHPRGLPHPPIPHLVAAPVKQVQ